MMLNLIIEMLLLYTFFFLLIEYSKAHKAGLKGKELWTEIIINKWEVFVSGGTKLAMIGVIAGGAYFSYCDGRDFENESWFNKKLCASAYHEQRNQAREERLQAEQHAHEKEGREHEKAMQEKQHAHEERMLEKQLSQQSAAPLPGFVADNTFGWLTHDNQEQYEPLHLGLWVCDDYSTPNLQEGHNYIGHSYIVFNDSHEWYYDDVSCEA